MAEQDWLAERFDEHRAHLRSVAYRMLGSLHEADDAVQESWLRLSRSDTGDVANLRAWLTTVTGRICLDMLRARGSRREQPLDVHVPDPIVSPAGGVDPEQEALLAESVGLALYVVLETLNPAERLAFVLHDMFAVPFNDIAAMLGRSTDATKQLASRARGRVRAGGPQPDADLTRQQEAVRAFYEAAHRGDFDALVALLDPEAEMHSDGGATRPQVTGVTRGAAAIAGRALMFAHPDATVRPALVNGAAGAVVVVSGRPVSVMGFTVRDGVIVAIDVLADLDRLGRLDLSGLESA
ncbi:sigma-70 family RNA polymerase sigma factor [Planotetraspora kaengkrachanensis]|uniref:DNA-directed RNA polymerase sigma-70 factor n=1 Tax=Planotetraspora kaengkrachanensis TaxID=575193 RepID=A0A8J3M3D5_9ACTN|nr:sigma-70 family RNA polymerase sigma factor [Planotetraspora kaengkrachanensis]GIG78385.1 DNA-directed RNA polymerase sigma-70 factor [Planotetraspora kaengkrachanensis]